MPPEGTAMSELHEALTAANVGPLIQKRIDPMLLEYQRRYSPLMRALPSIKWDADSYFFSQRTSRVPGGFVTDGGARPVGQSVYAQTRFDMKHLQAVGSVTGYAQEVTRSFGDMQAREIDGSVQNLMWDIENAIVWGNAGATALGPYPEFDGLDVQASQFSATAGAPQNAIDENQASFALRHLDQLIDLVETNAAAPVMGLDWMFVMSSTMNSKVGQFLTNQQRFVSDSGSSGGLGKSEVEAGLFVPTYRDIPIVKSSFMGARGLLVGAVTTTAGVVAGATLAAGAYSYRLAAVIGRLGEINASASVPATVTAGQGATLAFTPPASYDGAPPQHYKVYRSLVGGAAGSETLLGYVDANVGLSADGITPIAATSIIDTGATLIPQNGTTQPLTIVPAYVGTNAGHLPRTTGGEDIFLISRNADNIIRPYVRDVRPIPVYATTSQPDALPFAVVSDTTLAVRAPKFLGRARNIVATL